MDAIKALEERRSMTIGYPNQSPYPQPRRLLEEITEWI